MKDSPLEDSIHLIDKMIEERKVELSSKETSVAQTSLLESMSRLSNELSGVKLTLNSISARLEKLDSIISRIWERDENS